MNEITFSIDGQAYKALPGQTIAEAAKSNGVYIPTLCHFESLRPVGSCRICTVRSSGRYMAACTQIILDGMAIENAVPDLEDMRRAIIEMLFVSGNHFCPACEKSGNCELQALAYRYQMLAPRFPYLWPVRTLDAQAPRLMLDRNRCVRCLRCVRGILSKDGKKVFAAGRRGFEATIEIDQALAADLPEEDARRAMDNCPVGAILLKGKGFAVPIGRRKFDKKPVGADAGSGNGR